jgi:RHH-type proline utilization regulon transcriptional repressor/proline dehydrogenase/delta 1-pyrroline-5-carboxylate dehydrogenase
VERSIHAWGDKLFSLIEAADAPTLFSKKGFYGALMDWAMKDEQFKVQLFRFVDVLPTLTSASEVSRHLTEYLDNDQVKLSPALRLGLKAAGGASWLFGAGIKSQVTGMARQFMLGDDPKEILDILLRLHKQGIAFTVDVLGEAVVSEAEADEYAQRYLDLLDLLGKCSARWKHSPKQRWSERPVAGLECFSEGFGPLLPNPSDGSLQCYSKNLAAAEAHPAPGKRTERLRQPGHGELRFKGPHAETV